MQTDKIQAILNIIASIESRMMHEEMVLKNMGNFANAPAAQGMICGLKLALRDAQAELAYNTDEIKAAA